MKVIVSTELDDNFTKFVVVDSFKGKGITRCNYLNNS